MATDSLRSDHFTCFLACWQGQCFASALARAVPSCPLLDETQRWAMVRHLAWAWMAAALLSFWYFKGWTAIARRRMRAPLLAWQCIW